MRTTHTHPSPIKAGYLTIADAALTLGVTQQRVHQLADEQDWPVFEHRPPKLLFVRKLDVHKELRRKQAKKAAKETP